MVESDPDIGQALRFTWGDHSGQLLLAAPTQRGCLEITRLQLHVPGLHEPAADDVGPKSFQRRRTRLAAANLIMRASDAQQLIDDDAARLAALGIEKLRLRFRDGYIAISARIRQRGHVATLTVRLYLAHSGLSLTMLAGRIRVYGYLPIPAQLLAQQIMRELLITCQHIEDVTARGPCHLEIPLLPSVLYQTMPTSGWRLPALDQVALQLLQITEQGARIDYHSDTAGTRPETTKLLEAVRLEAAIRDLADVDAHILDGDYEQAARGLRMRLTSDGADNLEVIDRMLGLGCAVPELFVDGSELARSLLSREVGSVAGHLALAAIACEREDDKTAAEHFRLASETPEPASDVGEVAAAALACARLMPSDQRTDATELYERVLSAQPDNEEAIDGLIRCYEADERWHDLTRMLRKRIETTTATSRRAHDHVRLARILYEALADHQAALRELSVAAELAPGRTDILNLAATLQHELGDVPSAIELIEEALASYELHEDSQAQAQAHTRLGRLLQELGDNARATQHFETALQLEDDNIDAQLGAAVAAEERGDTARALGLWLALETTDELGDDTRAQISLGIGRCAIALEDIDLGVRSLRNAATIGDQLIAADAHALLAYCRHRAGAHLEAIDELERSIAILLQSGSHPNQPELDHRAAQLSLERARLLGEVGDSERCEAEYARSFELANAFDILMATSIAKEALHSLATAGDLTGQLAWLKRLAALVTEPLEACELVIARAHTLVELSRLDAALELIETAIASAASDEQKRHALSIKAWIQHELFDHVGRAKTLSERASLCDSPRDTADADTDAAEAWLDTENHQASLGAARAALDSHRDCMESVQREDPQPSSDDQQRHHRVLIALGEASWRMHAWEEVTEAYRELLELRTDDPNIRALASYRYAVALYKQHKVDEAVEILNRSLSQNEISGELRANSWRMLATLSERRDDHARAAKYFESLAADPLAELSEGSKADAFFRAGALYQQSRTGSKHAERCLELTLSLSPDHLPALDALEKLKREQQDFDRVAVLLGRKIAATAQHPKRQRDLLASLAELQLTQLKRVEVARVTYQRVLELDPDYRPALRFAAQDAEKAQDFHKASTFYQRLASHLPCDLDLPQDADELMKERVAALSTLDRLQRVQEQGPPPATAASPETVPVTSTPIDPQPSTSESEPDPNTEPPAEPAAALAATASDTSDDDTSPPAPSEDWTAHKDDPDRLSIWIVEHSRQLDQSTTGDDGPINDALAQLRILAKDTNNWLLLSDTLRIAAAVQSDREAAVALLREKAALDRAQLLDPERAADALGRALAMAPHDISILQDLDSLLRDLGDFERLQAAYEQFLGAADGGQRAHALFELGRLNADVLGNDDKAGEYYELAHESNPQYQQVWRPLADYWFRTGRLLPAQGLYRRLVDETTPADSKHLAAVISEIESTLEETQNDALGGVVDTPGTAANADIAGSQLRLAEDLERRGAYEAAIAHYEEAAVAAPETEAPLLALERLHRQREDYASLLQVLAQQEKRTHDPLAKSRLWRKQATLYQERLGQKDAAYDCLKAAHANAPKSGDIAYDLRQLAIARGHWALAAELLYTEIAAAESDHHRAALHLELALIYDEKLLEVDQAVVNFEQALVLDPAIPAAPKPLIRLYELQERYRDAMELAERTAELSQGDERATLLRRAGSNAEKASLNEQARRLYALVATLNPAQSTELGEPIQTAIARVNAVPGSRTGDLDVLRTSLDETSNPEIRVDLLHQLLDVSIAHKDPDEIHSAAKSLLEEDPTSLPAYLALKARARADEDWTALAELLETKAHSAETIEDKVSRLHELGRLYEHEIGDLNAAETAYERVLTVAPRHPGAVQALAEIAYRKMDWSRARTLFDALDPAHSSMSTEALAFRRGEIAEALGHDREAFEAFQRASELLPSREILEALSRAALRLDDHEAAIQASKDRLALISAGDVQAITKARAQLADLLLQAGHKDEALRFYELVLAEAPQSVTALLALTELRRERREFAEAVEHLEQLIAVTSEPERRASYLYRQGEIFLHEICDDDAASECYLKAIDLHPMHVFTLRRLLDYYWKTGELDALLEIVADLLQQDELFEAKRESLARVCLAAGITQNITLAAEVAEQLAPETPKLLADAMIEFAGFHPDKPSDILVQAAKRLTQAIDACSLRALYDRVYETNPDGTLTQRLFATVDEHEAKSAQRVRR